MDNFDGLSDELLVRRYQNGENGAFGVLLFRYKDRVFNYIYNIVRNRDLADDIFQDTFIKTITTIRQGRYSDNGKFSAWVMRIAHNLTIDHFRKDVTDKVVSNDDEAYSNVFNTVAMYDTNIQESIVYEDTLKELEDLMNELPETQREIVHMRFYQDLSFKEIADIKNISINTALGRMRYAVLNMRKMAEERSILQDFSII